MREYATNCIIIQRLVQRVQPLIRGVMSSGGNALDFHDVDTYDQRFFSGRLYSTERALWKLNWFLRDFSYDMDLLSQDQIDEKALINLRGVVRTTRYFERADLSKPRGLRSSSELGGAVLLRTPRGS